MGQFICLVFCFWLKEKPNSQVKLLWYCWVQVFREVAKNCRRKVRSRRGRSSADRSWMLATSRYRIIILKKTHAYTLLHTHTYTYTKKKIEKMVYLLGFLAFYIYASFFSLFFGRSVGASTKRGGDVLGGPLPRWELGKRCSLLLSLFVFSFISIFLSTLYTLCRLFWGSSSCPLARAQLSPVHPRIRTRSVSTEYALFS